MRRRPLHLLAAIGAFSVLLFGTIGSALAAYSASGTGRSIDSAARLPAPPAPTITNTTSVLGTACLVGLSWTAPPTGEEYTVTRTLGTQKTTVESDQAGAGTTTDTVLFSELGGGAPVYTVSGAWTADSSWTAGPSLGATASGCLSLL